MKIGEKASEYAEKSFPSDDISNSGKHDVAFHSYSAGANWMIEKSLEWFKNQKEEIEYPNTYSTIPYIPKNQATFTVQSIAFFTPITYLIP